MSHSIPQEFRNLTSAEEKRSELAFNPHENAFCDSTCSPNFSMSDGSTVLTYSSNAARLGMVCITAEAIRGPPSTAARQSDEGHACVGPTCVSTADQFASYCALRRRRLLRCCCRCMPKRAELVPEGAEGAGRRLPSPRLPKAADVLLLRFRMLTEHGLDRATARRPAAGSAAVLGAVGCKLRTTAQGGSPARQQTPQRHSALAASNRGCSAFVAALRASAGASNRTKT